MSTITENFYEVKTELFDINKVFDCGQCFRFDADAKGGISGVYNRKKYRFTQEGNMLKIYNCTKEDYDKDLRFFLSLDRDYKAMNDDIIFRFGDDKTIRSAIECGQGIRILRQDPFEALISFIISQNNNIPRIKKIISALCSKAGEKIGENEYAFPTPEAIVSLGEKGLFELKTGFRAKYIFDAASRVVSGETDLDHIAALSTKEAERELLKIKGVGPKVAACVLLFGFDKLDNFPIDVWIKRVLEKYYPEGIVISSLGDYAGLAQQYLFYYERYQNA